MKEGILNLATLALLAMLQKGGIGNVNNYHRPTSSMFVLGDSSVQRDKMERDRLEQVRLRSREVIAREKKEERGRGESFTGSGGEVTIIGQDTQYFNCVAYAKAKSGISASIGNGGRKGINSQHPSVGGIGVELSRYHAVYIEAVEGDKITITEANYYKGFITQRVLSTNDFMGFIL